MSSIFFYFFVLNLNLIVANGKLIIINNHFNYRGDNMNNKEIGEKIKYYRKQNNITQKELAKMIGKTESSIRKYEKGLVDIPIKTIEDIAVSLKISVSDLLYISSQNDKKIYNFNIVETIISECNYISETTYLFDENNNIYAIQITDTSGNVKELSLNDILRIEDSIKAFFKTIIEGYITNYKII